MLFCFEQVCCTTHITQTVYFCNFVCFSHGTKVAGIIAAKKNSLCGVGIAYDASIAGEDGYDDQDGITFVMMV